MSLIKQLEEFCYKKVPYQAGTCLLEEGQFTDEVYILASGTVRVTAGQVIIGDFSKPGDSFGEMAVILSQKVCATVVAQTDCEFYVLKDLENYLTKNPKQCFEMLKLAFKRIKKMNLGVNIMYEHINV